jgi:hypothetical protein
VEERPHVPRLGVVQHLEQDAQLHAVRVRHDLERLLGQVLCGAVEVPSLPVGGGVVERGVRIRDRRLLHVAVDGMPALLVGRLDLQLHPGAVIELLGDLAVGDHHRRVLAGVDLDLEAVGRTPLARLRDHGHGLPRRELPVHARSGDADPLLAPRLPQPVELGSVEELPEHLRHLRLDNAGAVVLHRHPEPGLRQLRQLHMHLGQDAGFLARVERIVHRLLHRREQRLGGAVEAEQVAVLGEELADGDLALPRRHLDGARVRPLASLPGAAGPGCRFVGGLPPAARSRGRRFGRRDRSERQLLRDARAGARRPFFRLRCCLRMSSGHGLRSRGFDPCRSNPPGM